MGAVGCVHAVPLFERFAAGTDQRGRRREKTAATDQKESQQLGMVIPITAETAKKAKCRQPSRQRRPADALQAAARSQSC